jgi:hypothetical protein
LEKLLPESPSKEQESKTPYVTDCDSDNAIRYPTEWEYTLGKIIEQLYSDIRRLSTHWSCYRKFHAGCDVTLVGYLSDARIVVRLTNEAVDDNDPEQLDKTTNCVNIIYSDAFYVLVPVDTKFQTGVMVNDQFLASIPNRTEN